MPQSCCCGPEPQPLVYFLLLHSWWPVGRRPRAEDLADIRHIRLLRRTSRSLRSLVDGALPLAMVETLHVPLLEICCTGKWGEVFETINAKRNKLNAHWPFHYDSAVLTQTSWGDRYAYFRMEAPFHTLRELRRELGGRDFAREFAREFERDRVPPLVMQYLAQIERDPTGRRYSLVLCLFATLLSPLIRDMAGVVGDELVGSRLRDFASTHMKGDARFGGMLDLLVDGHHRPTPTMLLWGGLLYTHGCGLDTGTLGRFCLHNHIPNFEPLVAPAATSVLAIPLDGDTDSQMMRGVLLVHWLRGHLVAPGDVGHCGRPYDMHRALGRAILRALGN